MDLIKSMKEYRNLRKKEAGRYISLSKKSISRLDRLLTLYHCANTAEAQRHTGQELEKQATAKLNSCGPIKTVIHEYQKKVDDMYPKLRFRTRKYYRAGEIENRFSNARASLQKVHDTLKTLNDKKKIAEKAIDSDPAALRERDLPTTTNSKVVELREIKTAIAAEEDNKGREKAAYIIKATAIREDCKKYEAERLNQIKQALLEFIQAIHPDKYSDVLLQNFKDLKTYVTQWAPIKGMEMLIPSENNVHNITTVNNEGQ